MSCDEQQQTGRREQSLVIFAVEEGDNGGSLEVSDLVDGFHAVVESLVDAISLVRHFGPSNKPVDVSVLFL